MHVEHAVRPEREERRDVGDLGEQEEPDHDEERGIPARQPGDAVAQPRQAERDEHQRHQAAAWTRTAGLDPEQRRQQRHEQHLRGVGERVGADELGDEVHRGDDRERDEEPPGGGPTGEHDAGLVPGGRGPGQSSGPPAT